MFSTDKAEKVPPTAAIPMENPCCSCKLTQRWPRRSWAGGRRGLGSRSCDGGGTKEMVQPCALHLQCHLFGCDDGAARGGRACLRSTCDEKRHPCCCCCCWCCWCWCCWCRWCCLLFWQRLEHWCAGGGGGPHQRDDATLYTLPACRLFRCAEGGSGVVVEKSWREDPGVHPVRRRGRDLPHRQLWGARGDTDAHTGFRSLVPLEFSAPSTCRDPCRG